MIDKQRERHLEKLADAFFEHWDYQDDGSLGLDGKRPFGFRGVSGSVCEIIELEPEGDDGDPECYSPAQHEYADGLFAELKDFMAQRWEGWSESHAESRLTREWRDESQEDEN